MIDKKNIFSNYKKKNKLILEIGSGNKKIHQNSICIDLIDSINVDIVGDIYDVIKKFDDNSVDLIFSSHCFEHLDDLKLIFKEISRVLKINGKLQFIVPHFSNPFYYSDPTHKNFFGLYTCSYFFNDNYLKRKVPKYEILLPLNIISINIVFRSFRPRYFTHILKKIFQTIFNFNTWTKEFYEENFTSLISCYEIEFILKKNN